MSLPSLGGMLSGQHGYGQQGNQQYQGGYPPQGGYGHNQQKGGQGVPAEEPSKPELPFMPSQPPVVQNPQFNAKEVKQGGSGQPQQHGWGPQQGGNQEHGKGPQHGGFGPGGFGPGGFGPHGQPGFGPHGEQPGFGPHGEPHLGPHGGPGGFGPGWFGPGGFGPHGPQGTKQDDKKDKKNQQGGYPQQQQGGYPQQQQGGYPQQQQGGYPQQQGGYPPQQQGGYPPQQQGGYPPQQQGGYQPQQGAYAQQGGYGYQQPQPESAHEHPLNYAENLKEKCKVCQEETNGQAGYKCGDCPLLLCLKCANRIFYGNKKKSAHAHDLALKNRNNWKCDLCKKMYKGKASFYCKQCDFDACDKCYLEEGQPQQQGYDYQQGTRRIWISTTPTRICS